jgi:hypothetical protein
VSEAAREPPKSGEYAHAAEVVKALGREPTV